MPAVGDLLADRFRIDGVLGAGGMATVYLATDLRLERQVAVKVLLPNLARDPSLAERFDREARILASISHPNVAEVFDVERGDPAAGREPFYVMELCDGGSLAARIEAAGPLEPGALVPIIVSIAAALGELHRRGLIHRDVKPGNILFTGGRPKLADFGLTKSGGPGMETLTAPGTAVGTPGYMAPELVTGAEATVASDVYALAATTFHGLTGRAPRQTDSLTALAAATDAVPRVSGVSPRLGGAFDQIVDEGLAEEPARRPSLNAFMAGLVAALGSGDSEGLGQLQAPSAAAVPEIDPLADTAPVEVPTIPAGTARTIAARPSRPIARRSARRGSLPVGTAVFVVAFLALGALALSGLSSLFQATGGETGSPSTTVAATTLPSPTPSPTIPLTASPSPTADPAGPALEALGKVLTAIDAARGGHDGLKGSDANDLADRALAIGDQLRDGDFDGARRAASDLEARVRKLKIDKKAEEAILAAIDDLIAAIPT